MRRITIRFLLFAISLSVAVSCNKLVIRSSAMLENAVWPQEGQNPQRTRCTSEALSLPLDLKWRYSASSAVGASLIVVRDFVLLGTLDGRIEGVKLESGEKLGHLKVRGNTESTCASAGNSIIVARRLGKESLERYDLSSGRSIWKIKAGNIFSEPLILDDRLVVASVQGELACYTIADGIEKWRIALGVQTHATPAFADDRIIIGDDEGTLHCLNVFGKHIWKFKTGKAIAASGAISESTVYIGSTDGVFYAIDLEDGKEIWRFQTTGKIYNGAAVDQEHVVFGSTDHHIYCLEKDSGVEVWSFAAGSVIGTSPLIAGSTVFFGALDKNLYALNLADGEKLWSYEAKGRIRTAPVVAQERLLFASEDNKLYCFGMK